uniref:Uncharacterized protein n=1 Tax=Triticum urartu TaxID=4572 RepID=A0A8R7UK80_TRIUA
MKQFKVSTAYSLSSFISWEGLRLKHTKQWMCFFIFRPKLRNGCRDPECDAKHWLCKWHVLKKL